MRSALPLAQGNSRGNETALATACLLGDLETVHSLVAAGADCLHEPQSTDKSQIMSLAWLAEQKGHEGIVEYFHRYFRRLALHYGDAAVEAAVRGDGAGVRDRLMAKFEPPRDIGSRVPLASPEHMSRSRGYSALHGATIAGSPIIVRFLVQSLRVDPDLLDNKGRTPLMVAYENSVRKDAAEMLVQCGARCGFWTEDGRSALTVALTASDAGSGMEHLLSVGAGKSMTHKEYEYLQSRTGNEAPKAVLSKWWHSLSRSRQPCFVRCAALDTGLDACRRLLTVYALDPLQPSEDGALAQRSPLEAACSAGRLLHVKLFMTPLPARVGALPLYLSIVRGRSDCFSFLWDSSHSEYVSLAHPASAVAVAIHCRQADIARSLLEDPTADLCQVTKVQRMNLLMIACRAGLTDIATILLSREPDLLNHQDERGFTSLMFATINGHADLALLLLRKGAAWRTRNQQGSTALDLAVKARSAPAALALAQVKREYFSRVGDRIEELYTTMDENNWEEICEELNQLLGIDHEVALYNSSCLDRILKATTDTLAKCVFDPDLERRKRREEGVHRFRELACSVSALHERELSLVHTIELTRDPTRERLVLDSLDRLAVASQLNPNMYRILDGETLLCAACQAGSHDVVEFLLQQGAEPDQARLFDGDTPLIIAARSGRDDLVGMLLAHGANAGGTNFMGQTALAVTTSAVVESVLLKAEQREPSVSLRKRVLIKDKDASLDGIAQVLDMVEWSDLRSHEQFIALADVSELEKECSEKECWDTAFLPETAEHETQALARISKWMG
jgi:ankyrin repeat protein